MNRVAARLGAIALVVLALVAGWFYVKVLRAELAGARDAARTAQEAVGRRDTTIVELQRHARDDARDLAQLEAKRQRIAAELSQFESDFETLKHENDTLRAWADGTLPDDVVRLYNRPAITGADELVSAMRERRALHAAGDGAANE